MGIARHTPGPWVVEHGRSHNPMVGTADVTIAEVLDDVFPDTDQQAANARLIAAAPDLLAACVQFQAAMRRGDRPDLLQLVEALHVADAAVAKATGTT